MPKPKSGPKPAKELTLADVLRLIKLVEHAVSELRNDMTALQADVEALDTKLAEKDLDGRARGSHDDE